MAKNETITMIVTHTIGPRNVSSGEGFVVWIVKRLKDGLVWRFSTLEAARDFLALEV
jgi:hypothetical protein